MPHRWQWRESLNLPPLTWSSLELESRESFLWTSCPVVQSSFIWCCSYFWAVGCGSAEHAVLQLLPADPAPQGLARGNSRLRTVWTSKSECGVLCSFNLFPTSEKLQQGPPQSPDRPLVKASGKGAKHLVPWGLMRSACLPVIQRSSCERY